MPGQANRIHSAVSTAGQLAGQLNLGGSYVELSGGLFRIFVAEIDVVPDPMLPAKDEQDANPSGGINRGVRRACRSYIGLRSSTPGARCSS